MEAQHTRRSVLAGKKGRSANVMGLTNLEIADRLDEVADLLEAQRANPYRFQA